MSLIKYPYTNLHEINLDWLIEEVKKCYSPENPPDMAVLSVNGMTGEVTLYTDPAAVLPEIEGTTWSLGRTAAGTLVGIKFNKTLPLQRMNGASLFNIYDEGNPPPYPVTSVNGRTGAVQVQEAFFSLTGDTITFITDSPDHSWSLDRATVDGSISLRLDTTNDTPSAYLEYVSDDETITRTIKLLTPDDIPSSAGVVSVNGMAGVVALDGDDIPKEDGSAISVASAINGLENDTEALTNKIGNTAMGTQATTVTGAVKEHSTAIAAANTNITNINTKIGNVGNTPLQDQVDGINTKLGNVGATPVQDQINALNNQITNVTTGQIAINSSKVSSGTLDITTCRKTGKIVNVAARVYGITDGTVSATGVFFNIPEGFRPVATTYGYAYLTIDGGFVPVFAQIGTNGEIQINYTGSRYVTQAFFCATYVI